MKVNINRAVDIACVLALCASVAVAHAGNRSRAIQKEEQRALEAAAYQRQVQVRVENIDLRGEDRDISLSENWPNLLGHRNKWDKNQ
jgi:hypothetical protein